MARHKIPTAPYRTFGKFDEALAYVKTVKAGDIVIKVVVIVVMVMMVVMMGRDGNSDDGDNSDGAGEGEGDVGG